MRSADCRCHRRRGHDRGQFAGGQENVGHAEQSGSGRTWRGRRAQLGELTAPLIPLPWSPDDILRDRGRPDGRDMEPRQRLQGSPGDQSRDVVTLRGGLHAPSHADTLGVDIHVVCADGSPVRNLDLCVRKAHLEVKSIIASPVATGMACLSDEERELGVALVELGAGVTNVSLFAGGMLVGLTSIPFGAADITDDIASAFGTRRDQAERMKCFYGSATASPRDNHDMIEVAPLSAEDDASETSRITRAQLIAVIRQRLEHLAGEVSKALKELGFSGPVGRQVVLTGGGAELKGMADYMQGALGRSVRIGRPRGLSGLPEAHSGSGFTTLAGLIHYAASDPLDLRVIMPEPARVIPVLGGGIIKKLMTAFQSGY